MPKTAKQKNGDGGGRIKCCRVELWSFGRESGQRERWLEACRDIQRLYNRLWREWLCWHHNNDSDKKVAESIAAYRIWLDSGKQGDKPKWTVDAIPNGPDGIDPKQSHDDAGDSLYKRAAGAFPGISKTAVTLVIQRWRGDVTSKKASSGSLPGWAAILLGNQAVPSFNHPMPVPFKASEAKLEETDGKIYLTFQGVRLEGESRGNMVPKERCELMLNHRRARNYRTIVKRMISGEWTMKGSAIEFRKGKWYALISYEIPQQQSEPLHAGRELWVVPGRKWPLILAKKDERGGRSIYPLRDRWGIFSGSHIRIQRERILRERRTRHERYRWAGSSQKGHGRNRALQPVLRLSDRWKELVKRTNHAVSREIVNQAIADRVGKLVYWQPKEAQRDSRFLVTIGNRANSGMGWDFFQFGTLLANKCQEAGIEFTKYERKETPAKKPETKAPANRLPGVRKPNESRGRVRKVGRAGGVR